MTDPEYLRPYRDAVRLHGPRFEATLWLNRDKQADRFRVMTEMMDLTGRTILDAGCGLGDFAHWMNDADVAYGRYIGVEAMEGMVAAARDRAIPESDFLVGDFADPDAFAPPEAGERGPDIVVFSGSLNTFDEADARTVLERAWDVCREGVIFNFLSAASLKPREEGDPARRFDPVSMTRWALGRTPRIRVRSDYMEGHDMTIALLRR